MVSHLINQNTQPPHYLEGAWEDNLKGQNPTVVSMRESKGPLNGGYREEAQVKLWGGKEQEEKCRSMLLALILF